MSRYTDLDLLLADLLPEISSEPQKEAVGRVLDSACAFIDRYCRRPAGYFAAASVTPSTKRIRGEGRRFLRIPQHVAGSATVAGFHSSIYYEADNGWLYLQFNEALAGFSDLDDFDDDLVRGVFVRGRLYDVTARWGFAAVPFEIEEAARLLTQKVWETQRGILGDLTPSGYVVERSMPLFVRETLDLYRKREFEV